MCILSPQGCLLLINNFKDPNTGIKRIIKFKQTSLNTKYLMFFHFFFVLYIINFLYFKNNKPMIFLIL
jgi:hypothetical protein